MINSTMWILVFSLLLFIFEMLRRKIIREKYAVVWLGFALAVILGTIFPGALNKLSRFLGFQVLSNFVLLIFGLCTLFIVMQLSLNLGKLEDQTQTLAEEIALLKTKIEDTE